MRRARRARDAKPAARGPGKGCDHRRSKITVLDQLRFRDGRLVEHLGVPDQLGLLVQLGLFGPREPAPVTS